MTREAPHIVFFYVVQLCIQESNRGRIRQIPAGLPLTYAAELLAETTSREDANPRDTNLVKVGTCGPQWDRTIISPALRPVALPEELRVAPIKLEVHT